RGSAALFRDPAGAEFGGWQRGTLAGAQIGVEPDTVCWSELVTGDEAGAECFYGKVFGWSAQTGVLAPERGYREWQGNGRVVAGLVPASGAEPARWRTTVEVLEVTAAVQRCLDLGGRVLQGPVGHRPRRRRTRPDRGRPGPPRACPGARSRRPAGWAAGAGRAAPRRPPAAVPPRSARRRRPARRPGPARRPDPAGRPPRAAGSARRPVAATPPAGHRRAGRRARAGA